MNIWQELPRPFFVLAPMDDVTDTVFRSVVASCSPPDLYFTEFVNVDGLQSVGRDMLLKRLRFTKKEKPLIAQLWGKDPKHFYKTAQEIVSMGFDGIDLNFGCPDKTVIKNGCCSALIEDRPKALAIIHATQAGSAGRLPISIKTRLGFNSVDTSWHELLLQQKIEALIIHGRTKKQMSNVPADWDIIGQIREMRDNIAPNTVIVGNGDVINRNQGITLASKYNLEGIMIGRGIFHDPFLFTHSTSPWLEYSPKKRIKLYRHHVDLFAKTWQYNERKIYTLNKFCKIYIQGFDGAKELREKLMSARSTDELVYLLDTAL